MADVYAGANDRKVLVDAIGIVEALGSQFGKERGLRGTTADLYGRVGADVADGLEILCVQPHRFARPRSQRFYPLGHARSAVPLLVDFHVDHLPHGIEPRAVEAYLVAGLDQGAAVKRVIAGNGVFHLQTQQLAVRTDADRRAGIAAIVDIFVRRPGRDDSRWRPRASGRIGQGNAAFHARRTDGTRLTRWHVGIGLRRQRSIARSPGFSRNFRGIPAEAGATSGLSGPSYGGCNARRRGLIGRRRRGTATGAEDQCAQHNDRQPPGPARCAVAGL